MVRFPTNFTLGIPFMSSNIVDSKLVGVHLLPAESALYPVLGLVLGVHVLALA